MQIYVHRPNTLHSRRTNTESFYNYPTRAYLWKEFINHVTLVAYGEMDWGIIMDYITSLLTFWDIGSLLGSLR